MRKIHHGLNDFFNGLQTHFVQQNRHKHRHHNAQRQLHGGDEKCVEHNFINVRNVHQIAKIFQSNKGRAEDSLFG